MVSVPVPLVDSGLVVSAYKTINANVVQSVSPRLPHVCIGVGGQINNLCPYGSLTLLLPSRTPVPSLLDLPTVQAVGSLTSSTRRSR